MKVSKSYLTMLDARLNDCEYLNKVCEFLTRSNSKLVACIENHIKESDYEAYLDLRDIVIDQMNLAKMICDRSNVITKIIENELNQLKDAEEASATESETENN